MIPDILCNAGGVTGTAGIGLYLDATFTPTCTAPDEGLLGEDTVTLPPAAAGSCAPSGSGSVRCCC